MHCYDANAIYQHLEIFDREKKKEKKVKVRGVARGEHRLPPLFSQSHVIFIISYRRINTSTKFLQLSSESNNHRKADYKAICKQTFELCFDRAVSDLESQEFKGHKNGNIPDRVV